jgi:hypothetical protein
MIKIGMKGLAKFMTSDDSQRRRVLKDYKFPDPEGSAQAYYYREARDFIETFHKRNHEPGWLSEMAGRLRVLGAAASGRTSARLRHNARALDQYQEHFSDRKFSVETDFRKKLLVNGVSISVIPDLHVKERKAEKLIKLEFVKDEMHPDIPKIICQLMLWAASELGLQIRSSGVCVYDVPRGGVHKEARIGSRIQKRVEDSCQNLVAIWDTILK